MRLLRRVLPAGAFLLAAACQNAAPEAARVTEIVATTSFGMCVGYCRTRLEIVAGEARLIRDGQGGRGATLPPAQIYKTPLTAEEWRAFQDLASEADIDKLPDVIGCPDCADGGAESLTIAGPEGRKTITFDYGAAISEAEPLLARVRALREKLTPPQ